jgi:hypothetical protein
MTELAYIASPSYSGSTLLTFLLGAHPQVATVGELKAIPAYFGADQYRCSCGELIRECAFWKQTSRELSNGNGGVDLSELGTHFRLPSRRVADRVLRARIRGPAFEAARRIALRVVPAVRREFPRILERNRKLVDAVLRIRKARVFLDGSKDPVRLKYLLQSSGWKVKVIYLVRDGRGATCSYMRHYETRMQAAATEWRRTHEEIERILPVLSPGSCVRVHYEQLCADPDGTLAGIFELLNLDPALAERDFRDVEQHILGNAMRLACTSEIKLDERWRAALTAGDLDVFERVAGDLNRQYGYA